MDKPVIEEEFNKKVDLGMIPELSEVFVEITEKKFPNNKLKFQITEMPILYSKKMNRALKPVYSLITGSNVQITDLLSVEKIEEFYNQLLELASIVGEVSYPTMNKKFLEENASEKKLIEIIQKQMEVNGILNFFKDILKGVMGLGKNLPIQST